MRNQIKIVYRVNVTIYYFGNEISVTKNIIKCRIVKVGSKYFEVCPYPVEYGNLSSVKISLEDCTAQREAEEQSSILIAKLVSAIELLKKETVILDKLAE